MINYEELIKCLHEINEQINELKEDGITDNIKLLKHARFTHKNINDELKSFIISDFTRVMKCINRIIKKVDDYTNQYSYDEIIDKLRNREVTTSNNIEVIFKKWLEFLIENEIIKNKYYENYNPIEYIEPELHENDQNEIIPIQKPRCNQEEAYSRLKKNGLETGIHCQATGCGKTNIILHYIDYTVKKYNNNAKIILFTERVNILKDLFDFSKKGNEPNIYNILKWKKQGIADLEDVTFINRVTIKKSDWMDLLVNNVSSTVLVINRAYLTSDLSKYDSMKDTVSLILHDECHNTSSERCNEFLIKCKEFKIPIVGFSATPLRTGKYDKTKLLDIYGTGDNKLNLLTNYNMIYAIQQDLILPPEFYWYHVELKTLTNFKKDDDKRQYELGSVFEILNNIIPKLPNKKIVAWCGRIDLAEKWKQLFENNHKQKASLHGFKFYLDTSKNGDDEYIEFRKSEGKCILFCANKHREGSDIQKLDACMFLDGVIKRGCIPFIQSIGRVLRKENCNDSKKVRGIVIDGIYKYEDYEKDFIDKIIGYYISLQNLSDDIEIDDQSLNTNYEKYVLLRNIIKFDPDNEMIHLNFNNNDITINVNKLHWDDIIGKFDSILQKRIKLSEPNKLLADFNILKSIVKKNNIKSLDEYKKLYKELNIIENPEYEFCIFWKGWYDFLEIDITGYPKTKLDLKLKINELKIRTVKEYYRKAYDVNLPLMPNELYKDIQNLDDLFNND
jgi:superfamily II DNA or RNA helicase